MAKITIAQALAEITALKKKIEVANEGLYIVASSRGVDKQVYDFPYICDSPETFEKTEQGKVQSINSLIRRRNTLQNAIDKSNCSTVVKIGDRDFTVSEAIRYKEVIAQKTKLLCRLKKQHTDMSNRALAENRSYDDRLQQAVLKLNGTQGEKADESTVKAITTLHERSKFNVYDPLKIVNLIESLSKEVDEFTTVVDYRLSESNALTTIDVD
jgi:hypothetical protein